MTDKENKIKLVKFEAQNICALRFAECEFSEDGGVVVVGGQNGAGKSSFLEAILYAFFGKKVTDKDILKYGADSGFVEVTLHGVDYQLRRTINKNGNETLVVRDAEGNKLKSPQKFINDLLGSGIDPSVVMNMDSKTVGQTLCDAIGLDLSDLDEQEKKAFDERRLARKMVDKANVEMEGLVLTEGLPDEPVTAKDLFEKLENANKENKAFEKLRDEQEEANRRARKIESDIRSKRDEIERLKEELEQMEVDLEFTREKWQNIEEDLNNREMIDTTELRAEIATIDAKNDKIQENIRYRRAKDKLEIAQVDFSTLDEKVKAIRDERKERIAGAPFPIEGISFDEEGQFLLDGQPWNSYSSGERLFAAFEIATTINPNANFFILRQGAWIDDIGRADIAEMAKDNGYLVLMEVVGDGPDVHIYMDGGQMTDRREK